MYTIIFLKNMRYFERYYPPTPSRGVNRFAFLDIFSIFFAIIMVYTQNNCFNPKIILEYHNQGCNGQFENFLNFELLNPSVFPVELHFFRFLSGFPQNSQVYTVTTRPPPSWAGVSRPQSPPAASHRINFTVLWKSRQKKLTHGRCLIQERGFKKIAILIYNYCPPDFI